MTNSMLELVNPDKNYTSSVELLPQKGEKIPACYNCGEEIRFAKNRGGKHIPITKLEDGRWTCHFNTCPDANKKSN